MKWTIWWQGSGPDRGDHVMEDNGLGHGDEIAYIGDKHHSEVEKLVASHNKAIDELSG